MSTHFSDNELASRGPSPAPKARPEWYNDVDVDVDARGGCGGGSDDDDDPADFVDCHQTRPSSSRSHNASSNTGQQRLHQPLPSTRHLSEPSRGAVNAPIPFVDYAGVSMSPQPSEARQHPVQVPKPFVPYDSPMLQSDILGDGPYSYEQRDSPEYSDGARHSSQVRDSYASDDYPENIIDSYGSLDMPVDLTSDMLLDESISLYRGEPHGEQYYGVTEHEAKRDNASDNHHSHSHSHSHIDNDKENHNPSDIPTPQRALSPSLGKLDTANLSVHSLNHPPTFYDLPPAHHLTRDRGDDTSSPRESGGLEQYNPALLTSEILDQCQEPWSLSALALWLADILGNKQSVRQQNAIDALNQLFTQKIPTLQLPEANKISKQAVKTLVREGVIVVEDEAVRINLTTSVNGVLPQLTGGGCYAPRAHEEEHNASAEMGLECYSSRCARSVKKSHRRDVSSAAGPSWQGHYGLTKDQLDHIDGKEKERQSIYYEIIELSDKAVEQSKIWLTVWRDALLENNVIKPQTSLDSFVRHVFGEVEAFIAALEATFVPNLKKRQEEQGPFLTGIGDIFVEWFPTAQDAFAACSRANARAIHLILHELAHNPAFAAIFKEADENPVCERLGWRHFLGIPLRIAQRYPLLLSTVLKKCAKDTAEYTNLTRALEEAKALTSKCNDLQGFHDLEYKFQWGPFRPVPLAQLGHRVIYQGDIQRYSHKFSVTGVSLLLMDYYMLIYKEKDSLYHINRPPIPIELLVLENIDDVPLMKSAVMGIVSAGIPATRFTMGIRQSPSLNGSSTPPNVTKASTASVDSPSSSKDILYPFKFRCLGGHTDVQPLLANSFSQLQTICRSIVDTQVAYAELLRDSNSEPYRLQVLSDSAFMSPDYNAAQPTNIVVPESPLDVAITEFEQSQARETPLCRVKLNCATVFTAPATGITHCVLGTDNGAFITQYPSPIAWQRTVFTQRITHIAILEDYNIICVLCDRTVFTYDLSLFADPQAQEPNKRNGPQKLSNGRDVDFLTAGRTKDGVVLMYKKKKSGQSVFKMWEPLKEETQGSWSLFHRSRKEKFRFVHAFYIPSPEIVAVNIYNSIIAISAVDDIELLNIETKETLRPIENPDGDPEAQAIYERLKPQQPLCMLRYDEGNFFIAKHESGVMVDRSRRINPNFHLHWYMKPSQVCINGNHLILVYEDFIEILSAIDGRRRQIIPGRFVEFLDDGGNISRAMANFNREHWAKTQQPPRHTGFGVPGTVKFAMQHPRRPQDQLILELVEKQ